MKKLIYMGIELDPTQKHELTTKSAFGFKVTAILANTEPLVMNNVSEVHINYKSLSGISFESVTHKEFFAFHYHNVEEITIEQAEGFELHF